MADLCEPDFGTAFYRSRDPIKNLKIKVCLSRVSAVHIVPQSQIEEELAAQGTPMQDIGSIIKERHFGGDQDSEEIVFKWQEKYFSQREEELYSDPNNCVTVLERKYNEDIAKHQAEGGRKNKRLFSYVDHDNFTNVAEHQRTFTTHSNEQPTLISEKMSNMRYRRNMGNRRNDLAVIQKTNLIDYDPSDEKKRQNHFINNAVQTMYIMVDCSPASKVATEEDEVVVCTIKVDANGVLSVKPDFNKGKKAYKVDTAGTRGREMFEYTIEHCSSQLTWQEQERETKMFRELYGRHQEFLAACVGSTFTMPPKKELWLFVNGEIESACKFEYDDLYITYLIDMPDGWSQNIIESDAQRMSPLWSPMGVTQTCRTKRIKCGNVAYFSFPFNVELKYDRRDILKKEQDKLPEWPQIYFEVSSLDSWQRHRVEGYGYVSIPTAPGECRQTVQCWRPMGRSVVSELRRFFIGGSPELEDLSYVAKPSTFHGTHLSKFGFRSTATGQLTVTLRTMQQSQAFLETQASKKKVGQIMDRIGFSIAQASIVNIVDAFLRAKKNMIAARENLKKEYIDTLKAQTDSDD